VPERSLPERSVPERSVPERSAPERSAPERSGLERSGAERLVRSLGIAAPGEPVILEVAEPAPEDGQAWVSTLWSGISAGTEVALLHGEDPHHRSGWDRELRVFGTGPRSGYPIVGLGYMEVARVTESRTEHLAEGQVVAMAYGHRTGHCADPARETVVPVPQDLDPMLGVFLAQLGPIGVNGLLHAAAEDGGPSAGVADGVRDRRVLVTGGGAVGLVTALLARLHGAASVVVADPSPERLAVADALGLGTVVDDGEAWRGLKRSDGPPLPPTASASAAVPTGAQPGGELRGVDVAFQCRGHPSSLATALKSLRPQGTVVDLAFYQGGAAEVRLGEEFHHNGLTIRCAQISRVPPGMQDRWDRRRLADVTLDLLRERGADLLAHLVSDVVDLDEGPDLLRDVAARRRRVLTAVLRMSGD
jgi:threonine dehydrogenase-like Zn-dependent dehydrogenase